MQELILLKLGELVAGYKHRNALRRKAFQRFSQIVYPGRVKAVCRLVQHQQCRLVQQCLCQAKALTHTE